MEYKTYVKLSRPVRFFLKYDLAYLEERLHGAISAHNSGSIKLNSEQLNQAKRYLRMIREICDIQKRVSEYQVTAQQLFEQYKAQLSIDLQLLVVNFIERPDLSLDKLQQTIIDGIDRYYLDKIADEYYLFYKSFMCQAYQNVPVGPFLFKILQAHRIRFFCNNVENIFREQISRAEKGDHSKIHELNEKINEFFE